LVGRVYYNGNIHLVVNRLQDIFGEIQDHRLFLILTCKPLTWQVVSGVGAVAKLKTGIVFTDDPM